MKSSPIMTDSSRLKTYENPNFDGDGDEFDINKLESINLDDSSSSNSSDSSKN